MRLTRKASFMKKILAALVAAVTVGIAATATSTPAEARWRTGAAVAAGVVGGALVAGAVANAATPYYGPAYVRGPAPGCYYSRQPVWNGYAWVRGPRVLVCP
jgi:hypothetical protein